MKKRQLKKWIKYTLHSILLINLLILCSTLSFNIWLKVALIGLDLVIILDEK